MDSFNWSAVFSGIALIVAIISPIATSILNNRHQSKMWSRNNFILHKSEVIERYIQNTSVLLKKGEYDLLDDYAKSYGEIFFYTPENLWPMIEQLDAAILNRSVTFNTHLTFTKLCKELSACGKRPEK